MNREEIEKLIGGYAPGILTEDERKALFTAALEDDALFGALADEQALRDLLADPTARAHLLAVLGERKAGWLRKPSVLALAGSLAAATILVAVFAPRKVSAPGASVLVARQAAPPVLPAAEPPAPAPAPHRVRRPAATPKPAAKAEASPAGEAVGEALALQPVAPAPVADANPVHVRQRAGSVATLRMRTAAAFVAREPLVRYTILRPYNGAYVPLAPGAALHAGDPVRLRFDSLAPGVLTVLQSDNGTVWRMLFHGRVEAGRPSVLPVRYDTPGKRDFRLVLTDSEQPAPAVHFSLEIR